MSVTLPLRLSAHPLTRNLQHCFEHTGRIEGLDLYIQSGNGERRALLRDGVLAEADCEESTSNDLLEFSVDSKQKIRISVLADLKQVPDRYGRIVHELLSAIVRQYESAEREESLMEQLSADWEDLENFYKLNTDFSSGGVEDAMESLVHRLTSVKPGLRAAVLIARGNSLTPLASAMIPFEDLTWRDFGDEENSIRRGDLAVWDPGPCDYAGGRLLGWGNAQCSAVAPMVASEGSIGCLILWCDRPSSELNSSLLRLLEATAQRAGTILEREQLRRTLREKERVEREMEIASEIHEVLLSNQFPRCDSRMEIAAFNLPSAKIDGDFYDYLPFDSGSMDLVLGDVMGKGVSAALIGAATKSYFLRAIAQLSIQERAARPNIQEIVAMTAAGLYEKLVALERFVTLCYARFDLSNSTLDLINCGHPSTIRYRRRSGETLLLEGENCPLGVFEETYQKKRWDIQEGDTFVFYTDGVTEARGANQELFGEERLCECIRHWSSLPPAAMIQKIRMEVARFAGSERFADDFTCVVVQIRPEEGVVLSRFKQGFRACFSELARLRDWVGSVIENLPPEAVDEKISDRFELSVVEAFENCIRHGGATDPIRLSAEICTSWIRFEILYAGQEFDPASSALPHWDGSRESGFGIYIISSFMDEFRQSQRADGLNTISLLKYLPQVQSVRT